MYPNMLCPPAGGAPAWAPTDLANLELWLDASDASTVLTDVDGVYQWNDKSGGSIGNVTQATGSIKPDYTATINSLNVVTFDGIDDWMQSSAFTLLTQPTTVFMVFRLTGYPSGSYDIPFDGNDATNRITVYRSSALWKQFAGGTEYTLSSVTPDTSAHIAIGVFNGASSTVLWDGVEKSGTVGSASIDGLTLGTAWNAVNPTPMDLCEFGVVDGAISAGERTSLDTYLNDKWAVY